MKKELRHIHIIVGLILALILCACFVSPNTVMAYAENNQNISVVPDGYPPELAQYLYPYSHPGTVICSQCNLRPSPVSYESYGLLKNGDTCIIIGKYDQWLILDLASCDVGQNGIAFVKDGLIKQDPYWIVVPEYTNLYATPWEKECLKNGEQDNRVFLVIDEQYPFYAVQCKENSPGTSFIYQSDVPKFSRDDQNLYVCAEEDIPIFDIQYGYQLGTLDKFTIVDAYSSSNGYHFVVVNEGEANEFTGYVYSQYFQKIVN